MFLKLLRHFESLLPPFTPASPSLGRKFLTQVFAPCEPVHFGLADLATPSTG